MCGDVTHTIVHVVVYSMCMCDITESCDVVNGAMRRMSCVLQLVLEWTCLTVHASLEKNSLSRARLVCSN